MPVSPRPREDVEKQLGARWHRNNHPNSRRGQPQEGGVGWKRRDDESSCQARQHGASNEDAQLKATCGIE
eukprot:6203423-Pleurochrysis_carterae.AAC.1